METSFLQKISKYLLIVLFLISTVLVVLFYWQVVPLEEAAQMEHGTTDTILLWGFILFIVCAVLAVVDLFVLTPIMNPSSAVKIGIVIVALLAVFGVSYAMSSDSIDSIMPTLVQTTPGELKWSDTGLFSLYIVLGLTFLSIIGLEVSQRIK
ncbi:MAG: hypothetical protein IKS00_02885 [Bacteroidales bacterium]|nr:hypothetical protein [Bacteroidales bacterium]